MNFTMDHLWSGRSPRSMGSNTSLLIGGKAMMHFLDEPGSTRLGLSKKSLWLKIFSCCVVAMKYHGSTYYSLLM